MVVIGERIRKLRTEKRVTQEQLANFLCVTPQAVSRWEREGVYPSLDLLPGLARYFAVSVDYLLGVAERDFLNEAGENPAGMS